MAAVGAGAAPVGVVAALGAYPSLLGVGIFDVVNNLSQPDAVIQWAMRHGLLAGSRACRRCPGQVAMVLDDYGEGAARLKAAAAPYPSTAAVSTQTLRCHCETASWQVTL